MATIVRRLSATDRREQLLEAAARVVLEDGPHALTMDALASAAGVSRALAYTHFASREQVLHELLRREVGEMDARVAAAVAHAWTFEDRVRAVMRAQLEVIIERGPLLEVLVPVGLADDEAAAFLAAFRQRWQAFWAEGVARELALDGAALRAAALTLLESGGLVWRYWQTSQPADAQEVVALISRVVIAGVRALGTPAAPR